MLQKSEYNWLPDMHLLEQTSDDACLDVYICVYAIVEYISFSTLCKQAGEREEGGDGEDRSPTQTFSCYDKCFIRQMKLSDYMQIFCVLLF